MRNKRKGQVFSPDLAFSMTVMLFMLSFAVIMWNAAYQQSADSLEQDLVSRKARYVTDALVTTPGYPDNWTSENVKLIGLATDRPNVLERERIETFSNIGYDDTKFIWGITGLEYEIRIGEETYGQTPAQASVIYPVTRRVLVNESDGTASQTTLTLLLWR